MKIKGFIIGFIMISLSLNGQGNLFDTIPAGSPIPNTKGQYTIENTVDTVITVVINELMASNDNFLLDEAGDDDDWFEIYNYGDEPIWMPNLCFTDNPSEPLKWRCKIKKFLEPDSFYLFWADGEPEEGENHCSFKLSSSGEYLGITYLNSSSIDNLLYPPQETNISYGRYPNSANSWYFFDEPSPEDYNTNIGGQELLPLPLSSSKGGLYKNPFYLNLNTREENTLIHYTTDCNDPTPESAVFENDILISNTKIIKARLYKDGAIPGPVLTLSFLFLDNTFDNPVISLVANDEDFYGTTGLISTNNNNLEVAANMEFIEDGQSIYSSGTGIQLHTTKSYKPRSFRLYARSRYGDSWFEHPFFEKGDPNKYKRLVLRNSGNDNINRSTSNTHFRDPLIHCIAEKNSPGSNVSQSRPVNIFLNGTYYGMLNMRERIDEYYIQSHKGMSDNFNLLEKAFGFPGNKNAIFGEYMPFDTLVSQIDTLYDISTTEGFQFVQNYINIENFTDYWITEVFVGNFDWLSNNVKLWKPSQGGRWEWIYWDLDHGLGLPFSSYGKVSWNTLEWSLSNRDRTWDGYNNRILRNLLMNEDYKVFFIKRFTSSLNTHFSYENTMPLLDSIKTLYTNDLTVHASSWTRDIELWHTACETVESYLQNRPEYQLNHIQEYFDLPDPVTSTIKLLPRGSGSIVLEDKNSERDSIKGHFFPGIIHHLKVIPKAGYSVNNWSIPTTGDETVSVDFADHPYIEVYLTKVSIDTLFEISEIYYNNKENYDSEDWIEIHYSGNSSMNISGFSLKNETGEKIASINESRIISPNSYFILAKNKFLFDKVYPHNLNSIEGINGELMPGEKYSLYSASDLKLLSFTFQEENAQWPQLSNEGYSIERIHLQNDPLVGSSWITSKNKHGSPGLSAGNQYIYHPPSGITKEFENVEISDLPLLSDSRFYEDSDGHEMAAIYIKSISGPGRIYHDLSLIEADKTYPPSDLLFTPGGASMDSTILTYNFIDYSGDKSDEQKIIYRAPNSVRTISTGILNVFPNPSKGLCILEIPEECRDILQISIVDFSGAVLIKQDLIHHRKAEIDISNLQDGMYIIYAKGENSFYSGKIILNK